MNDGKLCGDIPSKQSLNAPISQSSSNEEIIRDLPPKRKLDALNSPSSSFKPSPTVEVMKQNFVANIARILNSPASELPPLPFMFQDTEEAKIFNSNQFDCGV